MPTGHRGFGRLGFALALFSQSPAICVVSLHHTPAPSNPFKLPRLPMTTPILTIQQVMVHKGHIQDVQGDVHDGTRRWQAGSDVNVISSEVQEVNRSLSL
jgi:hypothetical protein